MGRHKGTVERYAKYRAFKAEGHTVKETAEHFGVSEGTIESVCRGIAPQTPKHRYNQYTSGTFDREENARRYVNERTPWFEYAGGFTGVDGYVNLRCKTCGAIIRKSFVSVKHGHATCQECQRLASEAKQAEQLNERERKAAERIRKAEEKKLERQKIAEARRHACPVCGAETARPKYCSDKCQKKALNSTREARRRNRIQAALVDKDITVEGLYKRDKGRCHICGGKCDSQDFRMIGGNFVVGPDYPTVDHVMPLSKGGLHSWSNVKLAHFACNTQKSDKTGLPLLDYF